MIFKRQTIKPTECFYVLMLSLISILFFASCKTDSELAPTINLTYDEITFTSIANTNTVFVETTVDWTATVSESWCSLSQTSGSAGNTALKIVVDENKTVAARQAVITFVSGSISKQITVKQTTGNYVILSQDTFRIAESGGDITLNVQATGNYGYEIKSDWITVKSTSTTSQVFSVQPYSGLQTRSGKIVYTLNEYKDTVTIIQTGTTLSVAADASGMSSNATTLASKMSLGWNLGNTLEATGGETAWGNPKTSQLLIDSIKAAGFNAVRLPVAWNSHLSDAANYTIDPTWLARVKEVVDYCYKNNMYVIVNIHWDGGWLEENCTEAMKTINNIKQKAYWEQIAVYFRNYDEHLLFASANEPNVADATQMAVLMSYHQTFINAVRSTGGRNAYRTLIVQGPSTDISKTSSLMTAWPTDNVANRLMAEIHYYTPWTFCGLTEDASWGKMTYYWGDQHLSTTDTSHNATTGETEMRTLLTSMKTKFVDKGIPVILGEFGVVRRSSLTGTNLTTHLAARAYFYQYLVQQARNNGIIPFLWDTGISGNNDMGIFVRNTGVAYDRQALTAIKAGVAASTLPY